MPVIWYLPPAYTMHAFTQHLTLANLLNHALLINMDIQPIRLVVHRLHAIGRQDAMFLGEVGLRERLCNKHLVSLVFKNKVRCV
jgi:hypothetical protein